MGKIMMIVFVIVCILAIFYQTPEEIKVNQQMTELCTVYDGECD